MLGASRQPEGIDNAGEVGGARRRVRNARSRMNARRAQDDDYDYDDDEYDGLLIDKVDIERKYYDIKIFNNIYGPN